MTAKPVWFSFKMFISLNMPFTNFSCMFGTVKRLPNCTVVVQKMKKKKTLLVVAVHSRLQSGLSEELSEPGDRWGKGDGGHDPLRFWQIS